MFCYFVFDDFGFFIKSQLAASFIFIFEFKTEYYAIMALCAHPATFWISKHKLIHSASLRIYEFNIENTAAAAVAVAIQIYHIYIQHIASIYKASMHIRKWLEGSLHASLVVSSSYLVYCYLILAKILWIPPKLPTIAFIYTFRSSKSLKTNFVKFKFRKYYVHILYYMFGSVVLFSCKFAGIFIHLNVHIVHIIVYTLVIHFYMNFKSYYLLFVLDNILSYCTRVKKENHQILYETEKKWSLNFFIFLRWSGKERC